MVSGRDATLAPREASLAESIGSLGTWDAGLCFQPAAEARSIAVELERAGYGCAWLHEAGHDAFGLAGVLLAATRRLAVGTSIVSIWNYEPGRMAAAARTLGDAYPGRFVLGMGTSHQGARSWHGRGYARPVTDMSEYLDAMDAAPWGGPRPDRPVPRMIAALGPRMLDLTRRRTRGAIPYLVPVEHTAFARQRLGVVPVLAVHQAVVIGQTKAKALELGRQHVGRYLRTVNYPNNLRRFGFDESDLAGDGSDRLIEALVAYGGPEEVAERVRAHRAAGADHVCVNPLTEGFPAVPLGPLAGLSAAV